MILLSSFIGTNPKAIQKELRTQDFPAIRLLDKINAFEELPGLLTQIKKADLTPSRSVQGQLQQKSDVPVPASPAGRRSAPIPSESVRPRQEPDVPVRSELRVPAVINTAEEFFRINQEKGGGTEYGVRAVMDKLTEGVAPLFAHAFNAAQKVLSFIDPAAYAYQDALDITAQPAMAVDRTRFAAARAVLSVQTMNASDAFVLGPEFAFDHGAIGVVRKVFGDIPLVVLTRDNGKDAAFLEKINAELVKANRPPILTASDLNAARSQLRKGRTAPLNLKAMVFATEPSAVMLKEQLKDDAILVTSRMFQNFLNLAGVTKLVERMQAEYLALARSA
jgi:hypothetical protein